MGLFGCEWLFWIGSGQHPPPAYHTQHSTHPLQTVYVFFRSPPGQGVNLLPVTAPIEWSQVTHTPTSIKSGGAYKPENVPLPDNCVMIPIFQDGSLHFNHTHKHSSPFRQTLHTKNSQPSHSTNQKIFFCAFFLFLILHVSVGEFPQSSAQPYESANGPLQRAAGHIKETCPPLLIPVAAMGKCNKPMNFNCAIMVNR